MARKNNDRPHLVKMSTPRGPLKYPNLNKPDYGTDKFPKKDGEYNAKLILDRSDPKVTVFLSKLDDMMETAEQVAKEKFAELSVKARKTLEAKGGLVANQPYSVVYDDETEEDTGKVEIGFKMKASGVRKKDGSKWVQAPALFDGKGKPWPKNGPAIWSGSVAIINFEADVYFVEGTGAYGITKTLRAAQIIDLVTAGGSRSASSYGFEAQEDGFSAEDMIDQDASNDDNADESGSGDEEDDDATNF